MEQEAGRLAYTVAPDEDGFAVLDCPNLEGGAGGRASLVLHCCMYCCHGSAAALLPRPSVLGLLGLLFCCRCAPASMLLAPHRQGAAWRHLSMLLLLLLHTHGAAWVPGCSRWCCPCTGAPCMPSRLANLPACPPVLLFCARRRPVVPRRSLGLCGGQTAGGGRGVCGAAREQGSHLGACLLHGCTGGTAEDGVVGWKGGSSGCVREGGVQPIRLLGCHWPSCQPCL